MNSISTLLLAALPATSQIPSQVECAQHQLELSANSSYTPRRRRLSRKWTSREQLQQDQLQLDKHLDKTFHVTPGQIPEALDAVDWNDPKKPIYFTLEYTTPNEGIESVKKRLKTATRKVGAKRINVCKCCIGKPGHEAEYEFTRPYIRLNSCKEACRSVYHTRCIKKRLLENIVGFKCLECRQLFKSTEHGPMPSGSLVVRCRGEDDHFVRFKLYTRAGRSAFYGGKPFDERKTDFVIPNARQWRHFSEAFVRLFCNGEAKTISPTADGGVAVFNNDINFPENLSNNRQLDFRKMVSDQMAKKGIQVAPYNE